MHYSLAHLYRVKLVAIESSIAKLIVLDISKVRFLNNWLETSVKHLKTVREGVVIFCSCRPLHSITICKDGKSTLSSTQARRNLRLLTPRSVNSLAAICCAVPLSQRKDVAGTIFCTQSDVTHRLMFAAPGAYFVIRVGLSSMSIHDQNYQEALLQELFPVCKQLYLKTQQLTQPVIHLNDEIKAVLSVSKTRCAGLASFPIRLALISAHGAVQMASLH